MQIFALDYDIQKAVEYHNDNHVRKQIVETCQLLSSAYWWARYKDDFIYKDLYHPYCDRDIKNRWKEETGVYIPTHINSPVNVWIRESKQNFIWATDFVFRLLKERKYRFPDSPTHACNGLSAYFKIIQSEIELPDIGLTEFRLGFNKEKYKNCIVEGDPVQSYRNYYNNYKKGYWERGTYKKYVWTKRSVPFFMDV